MTSRRSTSDNGKTYGLDGKLGIGLTSMVTGFMARTDSETGSGDGGDYAYNLRSQTNTPRWDLTGGYQEVGDNFNPTIGFLSRKGYRKPDVMLMTRWRPADFIEHPGTAGRTPRSAASGASTASRKPASCTSTTTGSSRTAPRFTPA